MIPYSRPRYEVADILRRYGPQYGKQGYLPRQADKLIHDIQCCRTPALGGHLDVCLQCGYKRSSYNSCRNRHCPKCQGMQQLRWVDKRSAELLPLPYFHLVFTLPQALNELCQVNKKLLYDLLFRASSETVLMLARDRKRLGATPGIISVLHTWGQNLMDHPHIHMIVSGGGISNNRSKWISSSKKFFLPVRILSVVFRAKFLTGLKQYYTEQRLTFRRTNTAVDPHARFHDLIDHLYAQPWIVYAKKPFGNTASVFRYLGRYTHRIAISNHRIKDIANGKVCFSYRDYADASKHKILSLDATEFIRRFLMHILPKRFFKIRYYGLLANRNKRKNLSLSRQLLRLCPVSTATIDESWQQMLLRLSGFNVHRCPACGKEAMKTTEILNKLPFW